MDETVDQMVVDYDLQLTLRRQRGRIAGMSEINR